MCLTFIDEETKTDCEVGWQVMLRRKSDGLLLSLFMKDTKPENKLLTAVPTLTAPLRHGGWYEAGYHVLIEKENAIYLYKALAGDGPYSVGGESCRFVIKKVYPSGVFCSGTINWWVNKPSDFRPLHTVVCRHIYIPSLKSVKKERVLCA